MWHGATKVEPSAVSNPFLETAVDPGAVGDVATHPQTAAVDSAAIEQARALREAKLMDYVAEMREAGHPRQAILAQLLPAKVGEEEANAIIDQADLFAGMMGRPHPVDINPQVRAHIENQGPMLVTDSLAKQKDPEENTTEKIGDALEQAEQMYKQGADAQSILDFLAAAGAPTDQARQVVGQMFAEPDENTKKKRFGLRRK